MSTYEDDKDFSLEIERKKALEKKKNKKNK